MLAYSTPESLKRALSEGKGVYFSRSREELWVKGATSGHTQTLVSCRTDCDRDSLLFVVDVGSPSTLKVLCVAASTAVLTKSTPTTSTPCCASQGMSMDLPQSGTKIRFASLRSALAWA